MLTEKERAELVEKYQEARDALAKDSLERDPPEPIKNFVFHPKEGCPPLAPELEAYTEDGYGLRFVRFPDRDSCFLYAEGISVAQIVSGEELEAYFERVLDA